MYNATPDEAASAKGSPVATTLKAVTNKEGITIGTDIGKPGIIQTRKFVGGQGPNFRNSVSAKP